MSIATTPEPIAVSTVPDNAPPSSFTSHDGAWTWKPGTSSESLSATVGVLGHEVRTRPYPIAPPSMPHAAIAENISASKAAAGKVSGACPARRSARPGSYRRFSKSRETAHDGAARMDVAGGLIETEAGVLLVRNVRRGGFEDWSTPGGVIDAQDADLLAGLTREVAEETGLIVA